MLLCPARKKKIKLKKKKKRKERQASKLSPPPPPARDAAVAKVQALFSSCRWRKGANLLRLHPGMGMRKVQFPFACCCCCGFRGGCCTSSKFPPPKAAAAAHEPMPREAAAIPSSKAKCRNWATSRSRRPTGSPCGWRARLRMQQFPAMAQVTTPLATKWCPFTAKDHRSGANPLPLSRARAFCAHTPHLAQFQRGGGETGCDAKTPAPRAANGKGGGVSRGQSWRRCGKRGGFFKARLGSAAKHAETEHGRAERERAATAAAAAAEDRSGFCGNGGGGLLEPYGALKPRLLPYSSALANRGDGPGTLPPSAGAAFLLQ